MIITRHTLQPCTLQPGTHQDGVGSVDGDLVVGCVAVRQAQVVVLDVQVQVRQDKL